MLHVAAITSDRDAALGGLHRIGIEIGILGEIHQLTVIFHRLSLGFLNNTRGVTIELKPTLEREIKEAQRNDEKISEIRRLIVDGRGKDFREDAEGVIWFKDRLCVPNVQSIRELILKEAHETAYSIHPGSEKMYQDLKKKLWWYGMKREIAEHVAKCDSCRRIKADRKSVCRERVSSPV